MTWPSDPLGTKSWLLVNGSALWVHAAKGFERCDARAAAEKGEKWGAYLDDEEEAEAFAEPGDGDQGRYVTAV